MRARSGAALLKVKVAVEAAEVEAEAAEEAGPRLLLHDGAVHLPRRGARGARVFVAERMVSLRCRCVGRHGRCDKAAALGPVSHRDARRTSVASAQHWPACGKAK